MQKHGTNLNTMPGRHHQDCVRPIIWVWAGLYAHLMWARNCDVLGQDDLCSRVVTTRSGMAWADFRRTVFSRPSASPSRLRTRRPGRGNDQIRFILSLVGPTCRLPSQNANCVVAPAPQDRICRPTLFMDCECMSRSVHIAACFGVGSGISANLLYGFEPLKALGHSARFMSPHGQRTT
jgi:hypothetical protein